MKKIILCICLLIVVVIVIVSCSINFSLNEKNILYSWSMDALNDTNFTSFLKEYQIKSLYQDFSTKYLSENDSSFIEKMSKLNVDVYHLSGDPSWGLDEEANAMRAEMDKVVLYNAKNKGKIKGVVFDVEPYLENRDNFDFNLYVKAMKKAYEYAREKDIYMVIAIAVWFDTIDNNLLEELIRDGCDEVSLMNYNIKYTKERMAEEVAFAKLYKKNINTIYEIDFGKVDYFASYKDIDHDFNSLRKEYGYDKLRKAYHHYDKMK